MAETASPDSPESLEVTAFDKLWNYGQPAETEAKFRTIRPRVEATGDLDLLLQLETQIARTLGLRGEFDRAHSELDSVEARLTPELRVATVRYLLERGRAFNSGGDPTKAGALFLDAFTKAKLCGAEFHLVDAAHMLGIVESGEKSLEWNNKAIALAEAAADPRARGWQGALLNNTAWTYHDMGEFDKALGLFEKCLAFHQDGGRDTQARIAKWSIARTLRSLDRLDEALAAQEALRAEYETAGEAEAGFVDEEIGECLWALDRREEAKPQFAIAAEKLDQIAWVEKDRVESLRQRSQ